MSKDVQALKEFLKAVDCNLKSVVCCEPIKALTAALHNLNELTFLARYRQSLRA